MDIISPFSSTEVTLSSLGIGLSTIQEWYLPTFKLDLRLSKITSESVVVIFDDTP